MVFKGSLTPETIEATFPGATKVTPDSINDNKPEGVYFAETGTYFFTIRVVGACPKLADDMSCEIYEERPTACRRLLVGESECNKARKKENIIRKESSLAGY